MRRADTDLMVAAAVAAAKTRKRGPIRRWGTVTEAGTDPTVHMDDGGTVPATSAIGSVSSGDRVRVEFDSGAVYVVGSR